MKAFRFSGLLIALVLTAASVSAQAPEVIASASFLVNNTDLWKIHKVLEKGEIFLVAKDKDDKELWKSNALGSEDKKFHLEGVATTLSTVDLDNDKLPEILTAAFYGPKASGLYGFRIDVAQKKLLPMQSFMEGSEPRDCVVSDIRVDDGSDFRVDSKGRVSALGMSFEESGPVPAQWDFELTAKGFEMKDKRLLPADKKTDEKTEDKKEEKKDGK